ncbi:Fe-S cluster assembly protein SufD [Cyclobacterium jeungdonense]|uniref:Fe-S cluster assembly protein SufD n=1 Tax=Cyclobacterium jeungdonense TaxID=708087 RepID=A0ABT8CAK2_9BACT|nr:Fe-S cluster assembly protein SufD [Cyclobacterium jeungdonense]MDN3689829.1 Fe-S cluster assembly protein SufD [Cyclobacterium jeungdonense]
MTVSIKKDHKLADAFLSVTEGMQDLTLYSNLKKSAKDILADSGMPTLKNEEYKYTAISKRISDQITHLGTPSSISDLQHEVHARENLFQLEEGYTLVCNNGIFDERLSKIDPQVFQVESLKELKEEKAAQIGAVEKNESDPFTALNSLLFLDGLRIDIPEGKIIEKPLMLVNFVKPDQKGSCIHPRVFIHVGKNAQLTLIEQTIYLGEDPVFVNSVTEWMVGQNAHVRNYKLQNGHKNDLVVSNTRSEIHQDASFTSIVLSLEGGMIRNNLSLDLKASKCEGNMYGLYLLNGKTHVDNHTNVDHTKPHSESNELYKGILADQSRGVFNGKIFVRQDAQKTNAFQQNNNILLSEDATINTKPQLEIWADDVKCSHGCTTGQLDEEALFYLRARGIGKDAAKAFLLHAFAGEVLDQLKDEGFKEYCEKVVHARLGGNY